MNINVDGKKRVHSLHENLCDGGKQVGGQGQAAP